MLDTVSLDDSDVAFAYSHYRLHDKLVLAEIVVRNKRSVRRGRVLDVRGSRALIDCGYYRPRWVLKSSIIAIIEVDS